MRKGFFSSAFFAFAAIALIGAVASEGFGGFAVPVGALGLAAFLAFTFHLIPAPPFWVRLNDQWTRRYA